MNPLLCLDLETTGLDLENCQVLEIAAIVVHEMVMDSLSLESLPFPVFHCLVTHPRYIGDAYALQMNAGIFRELAGVDNPSVPLYPGHGLGGAAAEFGAFLRRNLTGDSRKLTVAGKNCGSFDIPFLRKLGADLPEQHRPDRLFSHRVLDIGTMCWTASTDRWDLPDLKTCLARAGLIPTNAHRALGDCFDVFRLIQKKTLTEGLEGAGTRHGC